MSRPFAALAALSLVAGSVPAASAAPALESRSTSAIIFPFGYSRTVLPLDAAFAVNASGAVAGRVAGNAAVYAGGQVILLQGKPGYTNLTAIDISDNGYVVGTGLSAGSLRTLFWSSTSASPLDIGGLGNVMSPRSVNTSGVVVGFYTQGTGLEQAFRWSPTEGLRSITPSGAIQAQALDGSATGYIAGWAWYTGLGQQAVRWYPDGAVGRVADGRAGRAMDNGSIFGNFTLWNLVNTPFNITPSGNHSVTQIAQGTGRKVGYSFDPVNSWRAWTTINGSAPLYLPLPTGALGFAYDVTPCGGILGSVRLSTGVDQPVLWTKMTCDTLPVFTE
jgi:hypothetical protein